MRKIYLLAMLLATTFITSEAQTTTTSLTVYKEFQPATIHLVDGRLLKVGFANIFLKNSSLLYKSGHETKEANLSTLTKVDFKDRTYYRIDSVMAYQVDTVGHQPLYCAQRIDFESWRNQIVNNRNMTNISIGDMLNYTTADIGDANDIHFPLINVYYLQIDGKYVLAHERNLKRALNKEQRRLMTSVMSEPGFSWNSEKSLLRLLEVLKY